MWEWYFLNGISISLIAVAVVLYVFYKPFDYWEKMGIPFLKPRFPVIGSLDLLLLAGNKLSEKWSEVYPNERFFGTYTLWQPCLVIKDPELIEKVLASDFSHFYNRGNHMDPSASALAKHLGNMDGENWKSLRAKLVPTFSPVKLKTMYPQLVSYTDNLVRYCSNAKTKEFDVKDIFGRFSLDVMTSFAFGLDEDSINNPDSKFKEVALSFLSNVSPFVPNYLHKFFFTHMEFCVPIFKLFSMELIPKKLAKFFADAVDQTIEYRLKNNIRRDDFLDSMNGLKLRDEELLKKKELSPNDPGIFDHSTLVSNAFLFLAIGCDSISSFLTFIFRELALNPHVQDKLYEEILRVTEKHNGELSYQAINEMTYMDQIIAETLRLHPSLPFIERVTTKDYVIPGTDKVLPAGIRILIPTYGMHYNPQYFPQPDKFIPERFDPDKNTIIKGSYLAWGLGPRVCIGARFAKFEVKTCTVKVLSVFKVTASSKTKPVLEYASDSFITFSKDPILLCLEKREDQNSCI